MTEFNKKTREEHQKSELVTQHNNLIEAKYHLTLQEKRLMCWLASQVKQTDEDFKEHILLIKNFATLIDIKGDHLYENLNIITHKLMQKIITVKSLDNKDYIKAALLGGVKYYEGQGIVKLSFHPYLKPYMLQLKERFTQIKLGDLIGLKSVYSIRIYELLKQYEILGKRKILLCELREYFGITPNNYKRYNDFKKDVLERVKKEINEKTDLKIDFFEIKESRKIVAIQWKIAKKNSVKEKQLQKITEIQKELRSKDVIIEALLEYGFRKPMSNRLLKDHGEEVIKNALRAVDLQIQRKHARNPKAMLQKAIQEKWHPEVFKKQKKTV